MTLDSLSPHPGSRRRKKRLGRGPASGQGKTAGKGEKGQRSRSGGGVPPGFEGGQMPIYRKLPKRGFKNRFRVQYGVLNVGDLAEIKQEGEVDLSLLQSRGMVRKRHRFLKILGAGEISHPVVVRAHAVSATAREKIEAAGGKVELVPRGGKSSSA
ncbi:MAG TPA: 50S ribosomal protein L15 [Thermodesulfobacteriaceae bacterium]|nr:50S ribosomal protein L15 [Thermodesulfobacteriaceae bacterium]